MSLPNVSRSALRASLRASTRTQTARSFSLLSQAVCRSSVTSQVEANAAVKPFAVQQRGVKTLDFAGTKETVYERDDWPLEKLQDYFKNDTFALVSLIYVQKWSLAKFHFAVFSFPS